MISTRDLSQLPDLPTLRRLMQSLAVLDAILSPEWEYRYFSFDNRWAKGEQMGSMRDGQGNHTFTMFNSAGGWMKGFAHESPMSPFQSKPPKVVAGVVEGVPKEFAACLSEPAFVMEETTFCLWRRTADRAWQRGPVQFRPADKDPDGSAELLQYFDGQPETYQLWANDYHQRDVPLAAVRSIYAHRPLDQKIVHELNEELSVDELAADLKEIGYALR